VTEIATMDFFVVPTAKFRALYVLVIMAHERRRLVHSNIIESPTSTWTAQQITNAFPEDTALRFLLRDRDGICGTEVLRRIRSMGIEQKLIAPRSPWQNRFVERSIGTIRGECLDQVIILDENHLHKILKRFMDYYYEHRLHRSLEHDSPLPRSAEPLRMGRSSNSPWWAAYIIATTGRWLERSGFLGSSSHRSRCRLLPCPWQSRPPNIRSRRIQSALRNRQV